MLENWDYKAEEKNDIKETSHPLPQEGMGKRKTLG
jgi:hypothetical protein